MSDKKDDMENRPVFALGNTSNGDSVLLIVLTHEILDKMKAVTGHAFPFDFSRAGIPLVVQVMAAENHTASKQLLFDTCEKLGIPIKPFDPGLDVSIKDRRH